MAGTGRQSKIDFIDEEQKVKVAKMFLALEDEQGLNGWEMGFIADVGTKFDSGGKLTITQYEKIESIYQKFN